MFYEPFMTKLLTVRGPPAVLVALLPEIIPWNRNSTGKIELERHRRLKSQSEVGVRCV